MKYDFPIIAIGASAGGLESLEIFFKELSTIDHKEMTFLVVQHQSADFKSMLSEIIQRFIDLKVLDVKDAMPLESGHIYIIPPYQNTSIDNGLFVVSKNIDSKIYHLPIDKIFYLLSNELKEQAICIIFSGAGNDGTLGLQSLKMNGGMSMVQLPSSAEFPGMPLSAIQSNLVDYILTPKQMPAQLKNYTEHLFNHLKLSNSTSENQYIEIFKAIITFLFSKTGRDFSDYKPATIIRRVERRMALHQIDHIQSYLLFLQENQNEVHNLFNDLLIGVTQFFRDYDVFLNFEVEILPKLFIDKQSGESLRVWSAGCSTGEEAYTLAILIFEQMERLKCNLKILIFATDINIQAIAKARTGLYSSRISNFVTPERLKRFFTLELDSGMYRINKSIRDMLIFSDHDVINDPPFSKLDLVVCRNLLIYMNSDLQKKVIQQFQYALNPNGYLFLGSSETINDLSTQFVNLNNKSKFYQRLDNHSNYIPETGFKTYATQQINYNEIHNGTNAMPHLLTEKKLPLRDLIENTLLAQYAPASALVNEQFEVLYLYGQTSDYLQPTSGEASMNILKMAKSGLKSDLSLALNKVLITNEIVRIKAIKIKSDEKVKVINLFVRPIIIEKLKPNPQKMFLINFENDHQVTLSNETTEIESLESMSNSEKIKALEQELIDKEEYLKDTKSELQSTNQEMQSSNEELQSTNEELQTSKEELQSVNEELATINAELQSKITDLSHANNDMTNLLAGTGTGTIFVDHQKRVVRFTQAATKLVNLIQTDIGRPLGHIMSNFKDYNRLLDDIQIVLEELTPIEIKVQTNSGAWYLMRIRPYRTIENVIEGAVVTFFNITELKSIQEDLEKAHSLGRLAIAVRDSNDAIIVQDLAGKIIAWNPKAEKIYGWNEYEALGMSIHHLIPESEREKEIEIFKKQINSEIIAPYKALRMTKSGGLVKVNLIATALVDGEKNIYAISTTERPNGE